MAVMTHALQQSPQFARALTVFGTDVAQTEPVILQRKFGPLGRITFASRARIVDVAHTSVRVLNGETPCPRPYRAAGFHQIVTPAHIAEWDLTKPDLRAGLHGKWRNRLVKGETAGLRIREFAWDGAPHPLFDHANALARKRGYRCYPTGLLAAFAQLNAGDARIFECYDRGTPVAACLILRHGPTATYQSAWSSGTGHALQAPRILLWHAATRLAALGHDTFDLGVIETENARGLARFKLGTGAAARPLGGTWIRPRGRAPRP